jgi:glycosyltransferase involved in cell wall biosynthesis
MTALVSLIMPAFRPRPDWLRDAVASALAERDCRIELIVVDDGSDEPVAPLLSEVGDQRLRIVRIEHAGPYGARDAGLAAARGTYVRFIDADDIVEAGSTGRLLTLIDGRADVIAYGATLMCDQALEPVRLVSCELEGDVSQPIVLGVFNVYVVSILFPRAVIDRAGAWKAAPFRVSGDWDFVLRAAEHATARRLDAVVTRYRRHGASVTRMADVAAGAHAGQLVLDRYFGRHPEQTGTRFERRAYARLHLDRAEAFAWQGDRRRAGTHLLRAARRDPRAAVAVAARRLLRRLARLKDAGAKHAGRARPRRA